MKSQENSNPRISREDGLRGNLDMRGQRSRSPLTIRWRP
jgi:hypothetical protein